MSEIPITRPVFGEAERRAIGRPLDSGWVVQGPFVAEFEERFRTFAGADHAIATSSCTTALHIAVAALGLGAGDEVIVPAFTWVATANVVEYLGARPVFCDIDLDTFNIDCGCCETLIGNRTVGILPVHLFGLCAEMEPLLASSAARGLWIVEDAACAFGTRYRGHHAGGFGDAGCFSFHPRKAITTGEGGMITTGRSDIERLARILRDHGASQSDFDRHVGPAPHRLPSYDHLGYNYRLTDLQAALGCAQMDRAEWILSRRRELARAYDELLAELEWLATPATPAGHEHAYQAYVCLFRPEPPRLANAGPLHRWRNRLMARLQENGIATRPGTHAPVLQGYYAQKYSLAEEEYPNAALAEKLSLALPLYPQMTSADQERVVDALRQAFAATVRR